MPENKTDTGTIELLLFLIMLACFSTCSHTGDSEDRLKQIESAVKELQQAGK